MHDLTQRRRAANLTGPYDRRLVPGPGRHHGDEVRTAGHHRGDTGQRAQAAVEADFTDEHHAGDALRINDLVGHQHADGYGQIEAGAGLLHARWCQIDGDPARRRPLELATQKRGTNAVAGLPTGNVWQADHLKARQPAPDVNLDGDRLPGDPEHRGRRDIGDHGTLPDMQSKAATVIMNKVSTCPPRLP